MTAVPNLSRRARIGAAFAAARDYDRNARVQHKVALRLAQTIAGLALPAGAAALELGCGTGFLTAELARRRLTPRLVVTDLAPVMVERCRARVGEAPGVEFRPLDGEHGERPGEAPFGLIAASLTFQWFDDLPAALNRLAGWLEPGGVLAFTTLAAGTFAEWRAAHEQLGLAPGTPAFPTVDELVGMAPPGTAITVILGTMTEPHGSARAFLHGVKAIGAGTASPDHRPLPPGALRRVMTTFEAAGAMATYQVATCVLRKELEV